MVSNESVSKGFFSFVPKEGSRRSKVHHDPLKDLLSEDWHKGYTKVWKKIEKKLSTLGDDVMEVLLNDLVKFIEAAPSGGHLIPTVLLLTGVNLPDHSSLFCRLRTQLGNTISRHVAMLSSCDCPNIKQTIEQIVAQLTKEAIPIKNDPTEDLEDMECDGELDDRTTVKKSDCTMPFLARWYMETILQQSSDNKNKQGNKLVIVFQDFEGFQQKLLHNLILILSGYLDRLPLVLVFGVATTEAAIGESLTHQITSRLMLKVFQSQPSVYFLNNTLDKVFLTPECPFQLSGKLFKFFTDVFLFYDFSVNRFTQGVKYCVMDHFYERKLVALLCQKTKNLERNVSKLDGELLKEVRSIPSFKKYIETHPNREALLSNDQVMKTEVLKVMSSLRNTISNFYLCLRILHILVRDLPQSPLGKQFREVYCSAMCKDISKITEYKDCEQLLNFTSKDDLEKKMSEIQIVLKDEESSLAQQLKNKLDKLSEDLKKLGLNPVSSPTKSPSKIDLKVKNRSELKQKLAEIGSRPQKKVGYEALRDEIVDYLMHQLLPNELAPYTERTVLWEMVTVHDIDARNRVVPRIRAPIHTALNNPHHYLQCKCCEITDEHSILATMPDVCIAYKLHLEGGPVINVYDWLQSFSMIVDQNSEKKNIEEVDEKVQARFTQALAELEFLGFIKSSKSKPDHVSRLTWGSTS